MLTSQDVSKGSNSAIYLSTNKFTMASDKLILNPDPPKENGKISAVKLSQTLQKNMLQLKGECIQEDGKGIDYSKVKASPTFKAYEQEVAKLHLADLDSLDEKQKKVFFINLYNALTIHGLVAQNNLPSSVLDITQFWRKTCYNIGGYVFSLDDIEHGILRGNRGHPASTEPQFSTKDPRLKYCLKTVDPRIHFALVCGAVSCPAIQVYTETNVDTALDAATRTFCKQEVSMFTEADQVWLSKIFMWYRDDFGNSEVDVIKWIIPYLEKEIQDRAHIMLFKIKDIGKVDINYNEYDWRLNLPGTRPINL